MNKQTFLLILLACLPVLYAAGSSLTDEVEEAQEADRAKDETARPCIRSRDVKRTDVLDDQTIVFYMRGRKTYVNILPRLCRGLSRDRRFSYSSSMGRLCSSDSIRILDDTGRGLQEGKSCRLGYFQPIDKADIPGFIERLNKPPSARPPQPPEPVDITKETG